MPTQNLGSTSLSKTHLPHITHTQAGLNRWDPVHNSIFEVTFEDLPAALGGQSGDWQQERMILTEQVLTVAGLDALQKTTGAGEQKFFGATVSFLNPVLDSGTAADLTITFNLNLNKTNDNYVLKLFKAWGNLGYNLADGTRALMRDYCAENLKIAEANRDGSVWRQYTFHKVMLTGVTNLDGLDYTSNEARTLQCTFRADYWEEELAGDGLTAGTTQS